MIVLPNPFVNSVEISLAATSNSTAKIYLYDQAGRAVLRMTKPVIKGQNNFVINGLGQLANGIYILTVETDESIMTKKLIK